MDSDYYIRAYKKGYVIQGYNGPLLSIEGLLVFSTIEKAEAYAIQRDIAIEDTTTLKQEEAMTMVEYSNKYKYICVGGYVLKKRGNIQAADIEYVSARSVARAYNARLETCILLEIDQYAKGKDIMLRGYPRYVHDLPVLFPREDGDYTLSDCRSIT